MQLIGLKTIVFTWQLPQNCRFYSLYDDIYNIVGTQFLRTDFYLELPNPREQDLILKTEKVMMKKKKIVDPNEDNQMAFMVEAYFSEKMN